ncbi:unnamed protein product [Ilex paraguariensis]|uniref:Uncharacterized protein n=1 Tax=Ilex paraguariensis TaxID=185542 RepID=A0ABC8S224_9AQUA
MSGSEFRFGRSRNEEDRFNSVANTGGNREAQSDVTASQSRSNREQSEEPQEKPFALPSSSSQCNLERFLEFITPSLPPQYLSKTTVRGWVSRDVEFQPHFSLGDLWEAFKQWSAYGAGVPLMLNSTDSVSQYYVPICRRYTASCSLLFKKDNSCLVGQKLHLFGYLPSRGKLIVTLCDRRLVEDRDSDYSKDSSSDGSSDCEHKSGCSSYSRKQRGFHNRASEIPLRMDRVSLGDQNIALQEGLTCDEGESGNSQGCLLFEYLEQDEPDQPQSQEPLASKITFLSLRFPLLKTLGSCDLLSSSWISVAWYPIYRIPKGPTLQDLDACFLTYHSLHTPMTGT